MSERNELVENIAIAGQADLRGLIDEMAFEHGMTVGEVLKLGPFLSRAWIAGAKAFQTEILARKIEAGGDFPTNFDEGEIGMEGEGQER